MEALFLIYDKALQAEVSAVIERDMVVSRYTRIDQVIGARTAEREARSGYLADRRNRIILVVAEPPTIARLVTDLHSLRQRKGHGLRAFVVPATRVI
jgi:hypothetical protein